MPDDYKWHGNAKLVGQGKKMKLSREDFAILQETWATNFPIFDQILIGYRQYAKALAKKSKHCPIPSLKLWTIPRPMRARWTKKEFEEALLMKTMTRNCLVPLTHTNFINTRTHAHTHINYNTLTQSSSHITYLPHFRLRHTQHWMG